MNFEKMKPIAGVIVVGLLIIVFLLEKITGFSLNGNEGILYLIVAGLSFFVTFIVFLIIKKRNIK